MNALAVMAEMGHNNPPEPTPFEQSRDEIEGLFLEAKNWLDGSGVQSQADADAVSKLLDLLRQATARADRRRIDEAKPFDDGKAEIQGRYNTLIGNTKASGKGKAILAAEVAKRALTPFLERQEAEKSAKADAARKAAEEAATAAREALRDSRADDLVAREAAEAKLREAQAADRAAARAEKDKAAARGGTRAIGLRSVYRAEVTEPGEFARWAWTNRRHEVEGMFQGLAERLCSAGQRDMPGVTITEMRTAQ